MKKWFALLLTACMVLTSFAGCGQSGQSGSDAPAERDFVNVAMAYQITTLDSGINTETGNDYIINHMYAGLFRKDENGIPQKELCEDYTVSDDGMTYTFTLKDGIVWSDGTPITAKDFEYSVLRALSYGVDNAYSIKEINSYLKGAKEYNEKACEIGNSFDCTVEDHSGVGITAVDDKTLVVELSSPCAFFPALTCSRAWVAVPQSTPQHDSQWSLEAGNPTSGPYVLSEINENEKAVLTKSDTYFGKDDITMQTITYYCMTDEDARAMAFETGEIDVTLSVESATADKYKDTDIMKEIQDGTVYFIAMNSASTGPDYLKDVNVRRALALAIDKEAISEVLGKEYYPMLNGYIPHGAPGVDAEFRDEGDADGYTLNYDPEQAKALLAEAGYDEANPLKIKYKYSNNSIHGDVATMLEAFWSAVGIEVEFDCVEYGVYYDQVDQGDFELCRYADSVDSDASRLLNLWTTGGQVVAAVSDPVYDEMCKEALQIADRTEYIKALHGLEDYLVEENVYLI
ncbi:MAG: peptide ABC transporter substrate-binding protein, partial [Firmicutes bacterium]|nr:peptide ABC transporter substrate-binding protein [Bacillota bacterium]